MTLQQLRYVLEVAEKGTINEAAKALYISQPSLSNAIRELEGELRLTLFRRTNRGVVVTAEGAEFLGYARQVIQQMELLEEKYENAPAKQRFSVSTQHYAFTANAFVDLIKEYGGDEYEFTLRETATHRIIRDVATLRSEMGVLYLSDFNEPVLRRMLEENALVFDQLFAVRPHVFISRDHPLAAREAVRLPELEDYPCLTMEQGESGYSSFYLAEEVFRTASPRKSIRVTDRAALINLMIGVDAYTVSTGVFPSYLHGDRIVARPLAVEERIRVGVITRRNVTLSRLGEIYLAALRRVADSLD